MKVFGENPSPSVYMPGMQYGQKQGIARDC